MSDKFFGDVVYDVWRSGGNPDAVSRDRCEDAEAHGDWPEEVAGVELRLQRRRREVERDMREWEANEWDAPANERFSR